MNKELQESDYVNKDAAIALKQIGFNLPTHTHYHIRNGKTSISVSSNPETWIDYPNIIDRPILQKAVEWLREVRHVSLRPSLLMVSGKWFYDYLDLIDGSYMDSDDSYEKYNDAVNAGIIEICEYIKSDSRH